MSEQTEELPDEADEEETSDQRIPRDPAGRFHVLMSEMRGFQQKVPARKAWREVLGIEGEDKAVDADLMAAFSDVMRLPQQIRDAVAEVDPDHSDLHLKYLPELERALQAPLAGAVKQVGDQITEHALHGLEHLSLVLTAHSEEAPITTASANELRDKVREVIDLVNEATDLDPDLRAFLIDHLDRIQSALLRCRVVGPEALRSALEQTLGGLVLRGGEGRSQPKGKVRARLMELLKAVQVVLTVAKTGRELGTGVDLGEVWDAITPVLGGLREIGAASSDDDEVVDAEIVED